MNRLPSRYRRWLLLLPVALVLVAVATASRLQLFWWPDELHDETTGRIGEPVVVRDHWLGPENEDRVRELELTVAGVEPATTVEGYSGDVRVRPAAGTQVWQVWLRVRADPEVPLGACSVSLLDDEGRESQAVGGNLPGDVMLPPTACTPSGAPGPFLDGTTMDGTEPRPASYQVRVYAVTADDFEPAAVRVWWEPPDYVEVDVTD